MKCKHPYYHLVDGELVCVQCGAPPPKKNDVEDKIDGKKETKQKTNASTKASGKK